MTSTVAIKKLASIYPESSASKTHHVGNPPTSFTNPWSSYRKIDLLLAFRLRFGSNPEKNFVPVPEGPDGTRSDELVRVRKPDWTPNNPDRMKVTWIGHASFLVETPTLLAGASRGIRILFDPVFSERTSPVSWLGPKRYTPTPCSLHELPEVDIICISHNHYDHLDHPAISFLQQRQKGCLHFLAPLGNRNWFLQHVGCQPDEASELDWWERREITVAGLGSIRLTCCPAQHGSGRSPFDQGRTLWSSWALDAGGKKLYFAGDTAYQAPDTPAPCPIFAQVGAALGPFDLALLPIGLCTPQSFMGGVHATPEQSIHIHREVKARLSIGMHYGTVRGGVSAHYEDVRDPPRRWREAAEREGLWCGGGVEGKEASIDVVKGGVGLCDVGETIAV